jgi:hypothetical protein
MNSKEKEEVCNLRTIRFCLKRKMGARGIRTSATATATATARVHISVDVLEVLRVWMKTAKGNA